MKSKSIHAKWVFFFNFFFNKIASFQSVKSRRQLVSFIPSLLIQPVPDSHVTFSNQ